MNITAIGKTMGTLIGEFRAFSSDLQLSDEVSEEASQFLQDVMPLLFKCGNKISKKALFACAIFIATQGSNSPYALKPDDQVNTEITVFQLLEKSCINIMDFFSVTSFLKKNFTMNENIQQSLVALERKYLIVSALYDKFESMASEIFFVDNDITDSPSTSSACSVVQRSELTKNYKSLCWMLFIVAKAKVLWHRQELLATFHLLLCCIGDVVRLTPSFHLQPPFDDMVKCENTSSCLEVLSNHFKTRYEEVKDVYVGWSHVASELNIGPKLPEIGDLRSIYHELYIQNGDLDESQFLNRDWHLLPLSSEQSSARIAAQSVRRTLDTADALHVILISAPDDLTESLKECLQKCTIDTSTIIKEFLDESRILFIEKFIAAHEGGDLSLAQRRYKLASRYYYIMLDALLKKESDRLSTPELTSFLQNKVFHKSLLACCLEVTLMSCGSISSVNFTPVPYSGNSQAQGIIFPWILEVFDLEPFQFFKIIESFIRAAPTITMKIINHLKGIEDKILEALAWKAGSSVFASLSGNGCSSSCKSRFGSPNPAGNYWSPNKDTSQQTPSTPHTCHAVNLFLNKVCRLAYHRSEKLCCLLQIDKEIQADIWVCIEQVLRRKAHLLQDRHLDQMIMCCIFAVCKAEEKDVRFKSIVACYGQLPNTSVSVYKQVLTEGGKDYIITFYNKEFNDEMKTYVISAFGSKTGGSSSSLISVSPSPVLSPFYSLPSKKNIFISPLPPSPFKNPNEIIFQKMPSYTVGSLTQSSKMLQDINGSLNVANSAKTNTEVRGKKRLLFDVEEYQERKETSNFAKKILKFDRPSHNFTRPFPK